MSVGENVGVNGIGGGGATGDVDEEEEPVLSYERLDVYQCAIKFLSLAHQICGSLPKGNADLVDQIRRASMSIPLNIGEGAGKRTKPDCRKYFDIARGSARECSAAVDVCRTLELIGTDQATPAKELLHRIVAMLTKLAR